MENGIGHERRRTSVRRRLGGVLAAAALSCVAIVTSFVVSWMSCREGDDGCGVGLLVAAAAVVPAFLLGGAALILLSERTSSPILTNVITALAVFFALVPLEMVFLRQIWAVFAFSGLFAVFVAMVLSEPGAATLEKEIRRQPQPAAKQERVSVPSAVTGPSAGGGEGPAPSGPVPPGSERLVTPRIARAKRRAAAGLRRRGVARGPARVLKPKRRVAAKQPARKAHAAGDNSELVARLESLARALEGLIAAEEKRESAQRPDMSSVEERLRELSDRIETLAGRVQSAEEARAPKAAGRAAIDLEAELQLVRRQVASLLSGLSGDVSGADLHLHLLAVAALRQRLMELGRRLDGDPLA
ncbi:MAG: hypothetical protein QME71_08785 [Dehalococcoidia bacterium]|nr:hypothetical protein [Dehalococcoidia bacterium]